MKNQKEEDAWTCPICGEENPIDEALCQSCGSLMEKPSYDQIADEMDEDEGS